MMSGAPWEDFAPKPSAPAQQSPAAPAAAPWEDFQQPQTEPKQWGFREYATDGFRSILNGLGKAGAGVTGLPADAAGLIGAGSDFIQSKVTGEPQADIAKRAAGRALIAPETLAHYGSEALQNDMPSRYDPQTRGGKFLSEATNFAAQGAALPLGMARGAAAGLGALSGLGSEAGGQLTEGTAAEPYARFAGALAAPIGVAVAQAPSAAQRAAVRAAGEVPQAEMAGILERAQGLLDAAAENGTKLSTLQAIDQASGGRLNMSELQRHAEGMGRLRSFFADIGDRNREAAQGQFARVAPERPDVSRLGGEVAQAADVAIQRTPEGARLNAAQAALGPRVEAREAGDAMREGLQATRTERETARREASAPLYDAAENAPARVQVGGDPAPSVSIVRQGEAREVPPGGLDRRAYTIQRDGEDVGTIVMKVDGDTAHIRDIYSSNPGTTDARGAIGQRGMSEILRQFLSENPQVTRLTGERVSGARRGGEHGFQGTGDAVDIPIPDRWRNQPPRDPGRVGQVDPTQALEHIDAAITNAKGDQLTALRRARRTLFDANGELDLTSAGNMSASRAIQSIADRAAAAGDNTTARLMGQAKEALGGAMESTPEIAAANREFSRLSRPLDNFDTSRPAGKITARDRASGRPDLDAEFVPDQIRGSTGAREFNEAATPAAREAYRGRLTTQMIDEAGGREATGEAIRATLQRNRDLLREHPAVVARLTARAEAEEGMTAVRNGPLGRLFDRNQTASEAANKLFPTGQAAQDFSPEEVGSAVAALAAENPRAAAQLVRTKLEGVFNTTALDTAGVAGENGAAKFRKAIYGNTQQADQIRAAVRALPDGETVLAGLDRLFDVFEAQGLRQNVGSKTAYNAEFLTEARQGGTAEGLAKAAVNPIKLPSRFREMIEEWRLGKNMDRIAAMATNPDARAAFRGLLKSGDISGPVGRLATIAARSQTQAPLQITVQPRGQE
jgi:hypothetical protein